MLFPAQEEKASENTSKTGMKFALPRSSKMELARGENWREGAFQPGYFRNRPDGRKREPGSVNPAGW